MNEIEYQRLADSGSLVNTYIPYGPYTQMIPYLSRRMYENMNMIKYMVKEIEMKRCRPFISDSNKSNSFKMFALCSNSMSV